MSERSSAVRGCASANVDGSVYAALTWPKIATGRPWPGPGWGRNVGLRGPDHPALLLGDRGCPVGCPTCWLTTRPRGVRGQHRPARRLAPGGSRRDCRHGTRSEQVGAHIRAGRASPRGRAAGREFPELRRSRSTERWPAPMAAFEHSPIRDFVPILVERASRQQLAEEQPQAPRLDIKIGGSPGHLRPRTRWVQRAGPDRRQGRHCKRRLSAVMPAWQTQQSLLAGSCRTRQHGVVEPRTVCTGRPKG